MNLFGKKKAPPPKLSDTIQKLREANDTLDKREKHLEKQIAQAIAEAKKKSKMKDKRGALFQIKRKRMYEKQIEQIYGKKSNIETQIMALEAAASNKEVLDVMKVGKDALKSAIQATDVEQVEQTMEDINEQIAMGDEIGDAMSNPIGQPVDEEDLAKELEEMEQEMTEEELLEAPVVPKVTLKPGSQKAKTTDKAPVEETKAKPVVADKPEPKKAVAVGGAAAGAGAGGGDSEEARQLKELQALMDA